VSERILTQAEIDALMPATERRRSGAGGASARYNFRRPDRVSREQIHSLHYLHDRFARNVATSMSAYLRCVIELSVLSVEQLAYSEFLGSLPDLTAFYSVNIPPFAEVGALEINPQVAFAIVDRMLGGSGRPLPVQRGLSEIEQNVLDAAVKLLLDGLSETWKPVVDLSFTTRGRETRPQMLKVAAPNEMVVVVVIDAKFIETRGTISLCIPASIVETTGSQFAQAWQRQRRELTGAERSLLAETLGRVPVKVDAMIETHLSVTEVMALRCGDVLSLPVAANQPITLMAGGVRKMTGLLAVEDNKLMVQIQDRSVVRKVA
jgi:flagellar motor switch protein FliM